MSKSIFFRMVFGLEVNLDQLRTVSGCVDKMCSKHGDLRARELFKCECDFDKMEFCPLCGTMLVKKDILTFSKGFIRLAAEVGLNPDVLYEDLIMGEKLSLMSDNNSYSIYRINNVYQYGGFSKDYVRYAIGYLVSGLDATSKHLSYCDKISVSYLNDIKKLNENLKEIADLLGLDLNNAGCFISAMYYN